MSGLPEWREVLRRFDQQEARAEAAEARARVLEKVLRGAVDDLIWMSGADDFAPGGKAHEGFKAVRDRMDAYFAALAATEAEGERTAEGDAR